MAMSPVDFIKIIDDRIGQTIGRRYERGVVQSIGSSNVAIRRTGEDADDTYQYPFYIFLCSCN